MLLTRASLAAASLVVGGLMVGCAAPQDGEDPPESEPEEEVPLDISVDSLDIVHGALRISATMVDGAADVSVRLGADCEHTEVGGGISTPSTLVWTLGEKDLADALGCGLIVRARVRDGTHHVTKVAEISATVDVESAFAYAEGMPSPQGIGQSPDGITVGFTSVSRSAHLTAGDSILYAETPEAAADDDDGGDDDATPDDTAQFVVSRADFARAVLRRRPFVLEGLTFRPGVTLGSLALRDEDYPEIDPCAPTEEPEAVQQELQEETPPGPGAVE
jgi:hypothetical protein